MQKRREPCCAHIKHYTLNLIEDLHEVEYTVCKKGEETIARGLCGKEQKG
jgi:hypothetical protein